MKLTTRQKIRLCYAIPMAILGVGLIYYALTTQLGLILYGLIGIGIYANAQDISNILRDGRRAKNAPITPPDGWLFGKTPEPPAPKPPSARQQFAAQKEAEYQARKAEKAAAKNR